ncbi:MAG: ATP-binding cassette domain-containing protein [Rhodospirillaceae bacterium]|jgi:phosphonate transport system ATP-binding protein|nr:ATP-binding cassette domain-containing protein [Rhodospirillaceae bacterium]
MALLQLSDDVAGYRGETILRDLTLSIETGERVALVGESGAGKSTLLRLIYERCRESAALVPQNLGLVQSLTVFHNVYMGRLPDYSVWRNFRNLIKPANADIAQVRPIVEELRLEDKLFTPITELSGGQKQRTAVGRALYNTGDMILGDEPVSAVDEHQAREILGVLGAQKKTVVLAMHDRALALEFTDRIVGIRDGRIVLDEATAGMRPDDLDHLYQA